MKSQAERGGWQVAGGTISVTPRHASRVTPRTAAYTLIEIMIVVAILGIVMAMGVPAIYRVFHKESMRKAVADIVDKCNLARAQAIMRGEPVVWRIDPRTLVPEGIAVEMLDVNFIEYKDQEEARVRFYPNGTCDELTVVLRSHEKDRIEYRKISLECTTGLATAEALR